MAGAQGDPRKWHLPGWRIEQRYSPGVLIGNWIEERQPFQKLKYDHNSTHRIDFRNFGSHRPDVFIRRQAERANLGLPPEIIFHHHGKRYLSNMVSWYDENYNGRFREKKLPYDQPYPPRREWNSHALAWIPEKSDHPVSAPPTNFGLLGKMQKRWAAQIADETRGDYHTTYMDNYEDFPKEAMVHLHNATPKEDSTSLHPINRTVKDWHLRGGTIRKSPEKLPPEMLLTRNLPEPVGVGTLPPVAQ